MVLITGATGNVGREVVKLILDEGGHVAAVSRNPAAASLPAKAHVIAGDPSQPQSLATAFKGIEAVLLSPRALAGASKEFVTLAASSGSGAPSCCPRSRCSMAEDFGGSRTNSGQSKTP